MLDAGRDWRGCLGRLRPDAIVITHAHPDHVGALVDGSPCPVYATPSTWRLIGRWPLQDRRVLRPWTPCDIEGIRFEAVPVVHSIRAPAVGYRITVGGQTIFYVPDVAKVARPQRALAGVAVYVGDGAAIARPMLRPRGGVLIGHASIAMQLDWCRDHGVRHAVFTHCGSEIVRAPHAAALSDVAALGQARGVSARIACDGERLGLPGGRRGSASRIGTGHRRERRGR
jgi:phosphoribosyl 1,2-cyclic phosphodiesterase